MRKGYDLTFLQRCFHAGCSCWLHADDFDMRVEEFCKGRNTGCKSAAADWDENVIYQWKLLYDLHGNGSLAGCYCRVIEWMNKCISVLICKLKCICTCFIVNISVKDNLCAITLGTFYLDQWCGGRHDDDCFYSVFMCGIGNTLCVVSCGCGNQAFISLFIGKCTDLIVCATYFVGTGALHVLRFQVNLVSCHI